MGSNTPTPHDTGKMSNAAEPPPPCFNCGEPQTPNPAHWHQCPSCGVRLRRNGNHWQANQELALLLRSDSLVFGQGSDWWMDAYTLRSAATKISGRWFCPNHPDEMHGHNDQSAWGRMVDAAPSQTPITLAILSRCDDQRLPHLVDQYLKSAVFQKLVVACDGAVPDWLQQVASTCSVKVIERPLDGHFGAQRNAVQESISKGWVFHLDTDEFLSRDFLGQLPELVGLAERDELKAVGFRRENVVNGTVSSLWPDTQYRLVKNTVRFDGRVHERPDACRNWPETMISLGPSIRHDLSIAHVFARRKRYESLGQSQARSREAGALLTPRQSQPA